VTTNTDLLYRCPACGTELVLYANGENGPADDRWTCEPCGIEYPHHQFPLPVGYVRQARTAEKEMERERALRDEQDQLAVWNDWAKRGR
jgi:DNA-directed RNA polymerase subunit RPC12/RpoP